MTDDRVAPDQGVMRTRSSSHRATDAGDQQATETTGLVSLPWRSRAATAFKSATLAGTALLVTGLFAAGCSPTPGTAPGSTLRVYAADLAGAARMCDVPNVIPVPANASDTPIKLANDGGWCAIRVHQDGPKPFEAGLLTTRPKHGTVLIHEVGDDTRIDYTPDRGFAGADAFVVKLIPGNATIRTAVTVTAPQS